MEKEVVLKQFKGLLYLPPITVWKGTVTITNKRVLFRATLAEELLTRAPVHDYMLWQMKIHPTIEGKNKRKIGFDYHYILENKTKTAYLGVLAPQDPQEILDLLLKLTNETEEKRSIDEKKAVVKIKNLKKAKIKKKKSK